MRQDEQSKAWVWRGNGTETDPWYWVKVTSTDIIIFSGFFTGSVNWLKFRADLRGALLEALSSIDIDFIAKLTASYMWQVPRSDLEGKLPELMKFSHGFLSESVTEIERFSTLLFSRDAQQRALFEGTSEAGDSDFKFSLHLQDSLFTKASLAAVLDDHFKSADTAFEKANALIESLL